jgi:hypothetical protein
VVEFPKGENGLKYMPILGACAAAALLVAAPANAARLDGKVLRDLSQDDAIALIGDAGGRVDDVQPVKEGGFAITATFPGDMPVLFTGMDCKGTGGAQRCPEYEISIGFQAKSEEDAQRFDRDRQIEFVADGFDGAVYKIWRMSFLYGGVTRTHVLDEIIEVVNIGWDVSEIFPFKDDSWKPKGPRPKDSALLEP